MKGRFTPLAFLLLSLPALLRGQTFPMDGTDITTCSGFFLDSGGGMSPYEPNEFFTTTICSDGSEGTHIQLIFSGTDLGPGDELCFYDGVDTNAPMLTCASDFGGASTFIVQATAPNATGCLTVTFSSDGFAQGEGWSAEIRCIPACQLIEGVLASSTPPVMPADTGWIDICPGDEVTFEASALFPQNGLVYSHSIATSTFEWDFGDGTFDTGQSVSHVYSEPGGYIVQLTVTDQFGCRSTNFISQRVRVAPPPTFVLNNLPAPICAGDTLALNAALNQIDPSAVFSAVPNVGGFINRGIRSDSLPLPDGDGASYETSIAFSDFLPGQTLTNVNDLESICVVMEHSWMRDLEISLTCPSGQSVILHDHPGQFGGEVLLGIPFEDDEGFNPPIPGVGYEYCWTPNAPNPTWINYANANNPGTLPPGDYSSYEPLTNLLGCPLNGEWTIKVTDLWAIDNGYIFSWSINFADSLYPAAEIFSPPLVSSSFLPDPSIFFSAADSLLAAPEHGGSVSYHFSVTDAFGCSADTLVDVEVLPPTHPDCHECQEFLQVAGDTTVCVGEPVELSASTDMSLDTVITFQAAPHRLFGASNHPPANPLESDVEVVGIFPGLLFNPAQQIVSVCVDLEAPEAGQLLLSLRAPDGSVLELSTNNGGSAPGYISTCFSPTASQSIAAASPPFTGTFQPEGNWNSLLGGFVNGTWSLLVSDAMGNDLSNRLEWWSITFNNTNALTYAWAPAASVDCPTCPTTTATATGFTNFTLTATDNYNCQDQAAATVDVFPALPAPTVNTAILENGSVVFSWDDPAPGYPYEVNVNGSGWTSPNNGPTSHIVSGLNSGDPVDFQVRADVNGTLCDVGTASANFIYIVCMLEGAIDSAAIGEPPYLTRCFGECDFSLPISAFNGTSPITYTATNMTTGQVITQNNGNFTNLCAGVYEIILEDANFCRDTLNFTIEEPPQLVVSAAETDPVSCNGGMDGSAQATAAGGTVNDPSDYTYQWSDPNMQFNATAVNLPAGIYEVTVTDLNGCTAVAMTEVSEPEPIVLDISVTDALCFGDASGTATVNPTGGVGNYSFQWSRGTTPNQQTTGGLSAGTVAVTVMDGNGCSASDDAVVGQPAEPVSVQIVQTDTSCFNRAGGVAVASASGGTGTNYTFLWLETNQSGPTGIDLPAGTHTVQALDENNCPGIGSIEIFEYPQMVIEPPAFTLPTCSDSNDGRMGVNIIFGGVDSCQSGCTFVWSTGDSTDLITGLAGGQTYSVTVTDRAGCTATNATFLPNKPPLSLNLSTTDASCFGFADGRATVTGVQNNQGPVTYQWDANAGNQSGPTADSLPAGTYTVVVTDTAGCSTEAEVLIGEPEAIQLSFVTIDNTCPGEAEGAVSAEASGGQPGYTFQWSSGSTESKLDNLPAGTYFLTLTDANGCFIIDSARVLEPPPIEPLITVEDASCFGERDGSIHLEPTGGTGPYKYSLDGENFFGSSTFIGLRAGSYSLFIRDANGCLWSGSAAVNQPDEFRIEFSRDQTPFTDYMLELGDSVLFWIEAHNNQGSVELTWDASYCGTMRCRDGSGATDCEEPITCNPVWLKPDNPIRYSVVAVDERGCVAEASLQMLVKKERLVLVPPAFIPDGQDPRNHMLHVHGKTGTIVRLFRVFDRWGEMVYQQTDFPVNDFGFGWDGTYKGRPMPAGVYGWYLEVEFADGARESYRGETTLIR